MIKDRAEVNFSHAARHKLFINLFSLFFHNWPYRTMQRTQAWSTISFCKNINQNPPMVFRKIIPKLFCCFAASETIIAFRMWWKCLITFGEKSIPSVFDDRVQCDLVFKWARRIFVQIHRQKKKFRCSCWAWNDWSVLEIFQATPHLNQINFTFDVR